MLIIFRVGSDNHRDVFDALVLASDGWSAGTALARGRHPEQLARPGRRHVINRSFPDGASSTSRRAKVPG
jgi:hypothetical protein